MTTTAAQPMLTSAEIRRLAETMRVIVERRVALTPVFDGALWLASVEVRGESDHNRRRILRTVSATGSSPMVAVTRLFELLDGAELETAGGLRHDYSEIVSASSIRTLADK